MSTFAKKMTAAVAGLSIVFSIVSPLAGVSAAYTSLDAANKLATLGVIVDHSANPADYRLGDTLSRREATKTMVLASDMELDSSCKGEFTDLPATDWGCKYAETALANGMVAANPMYRPDAMVTKIEALKMAFQARKLERNEATDWRAGYVSAAVDMGIANAFTDYDTAVARGEYFTWLTASIDVSMDENGGEDLNQLICEVLGTCDDGGDVVDPTNPTDPTTPIIVTEGDVMVSLNPMSPASQTVPNTGLVPFGKFDVTAGASDTSVNSITLKREGLSNRSDIKRVYFERNGVRVSNRGNVSIDDDVVLSFSPALDVQAGQTVTLDLIVELNTGAVTGAEHRFAILASSDVEATGVVQGSYPVRTATMRLGSYTIQNVTFSAVSSGTSNVNVGDTDVLLGEFRLDNGLSEKSVMVKTITLRNDGTADIGASLSNLALYSNGVVVSSDYELNGRDVTFTANALIEDGKSENYEVRADISGAERSPETYILKLRNTTDITVTEVETGFSAPIVGTASLGTVSVNGGDTLLSRDTSYTTTQTVSPNTNDVVLWAGKLSVAEAVELEDISISMNLTGGADLNQISSLRFIVGDTTVASFSPTATSLSGPQVVSLDAQFTVSSNSNMRLEANLRSTANGNFNTTAVTLGSTDARYLSNDEVATINGSAIGISTDVALATLSITQNDGIDNFNIVPGARDVTVLGFALRASDVSDVKVTAINPAVSAAPLTTQIALTNISNVRLYQGSTLLDTRNNFDFNSLNVTIPKNTSVSFTIVADFNTSIVANETLKLDVSATEVTARDISSNTAILATNSASNTFTAVGAGILTASVNSSTALSTIVTPATSEASAFSFDVEATNDRARVTDIYIKSAGAVNLAQALRSASLTLNGKTVGAVVLDANTLHFPLGSDGVLLEKDQKATAEVKVAFFDSTVRTNQAFTLSLPTGAVTGQVTGTVDGMRVISDSAGTTLSRAGGVISGNAHLLARSKPTVAGTTFTPSSNDLYAFSVTADANRKITLDTMAMEITGSAATPLSGATINVYRDSESSGNLVFTSADLGVTFATGAGNRDVEAGQTVQFIVKITGGSPIVDNIRETRVTSLSYSDDVATPVSITIDTYNAGVPTTTSSYKY